MAHVLYKAAEGVESLTEQALREAREERVPEPLPVVAHKANGETDIDRFRAMAYRVERGYDVAGQHGRSALARLIRREIARADGATPVPAATSPCRSAANATADPIYREEWSR